MQHKIVQCEKFVQNSPGRHNYMSVFSASSGEDSSVLALIVEARKQNPSEHGIEFESLFKTLQYYYWHIHNDPQKKPEDNFEQSLKSLNNEILRMIQERKLIIRLSAIQMLVMLIKPSRESNKYWDIYMSSYGNLRAYLIHQLPLETYKMISIPLDGVALTDNRFAPLFANIISGKLQEKDTLLMGGDAILEYMNEEELTGVLSSLPPSGVANYIRTQLQKYNQTFGSLICKIGEIPSPSRFEYAHQNPDTQSQESLENLVLTEKRTAQILSPLASETDNKFVRTLGKSLLYLRHGASLAAQFVKTRFGSLFAKTDPQILPEKPQTQLGRIQNITMNIIGFIFNLITSFSSKSFRLLGITLILFTLTYGSIVWIKNKKISVEAEHAYTRITQETQETKNQIEAALIYGQESKARELLETLKNKISSINPSDDQTKQEFFSGARGDIAKFQDILNHNNRLTLGEIWMNISSTLGDKKTIAWASTQTHLHAVLDTGVIYKIDIKNKDILELEEFQGKNAALAIGNTQQILILDTGGNWHLLEKDNSFSALKSNIPNPESISDGVFYNKKLYLLDRAHSQIYKARIDGSSLVLEKKWLEDNTDLSQVKTIAVDGRVLASNSSGNIKIFFSGKLSADVITLDRPNPELGSITQLYTQLDFPHIIAQDKSRVLIWSSQGQLEGQFAKEDLSPLDGFSVVGQDLYIAGGGMIWKEELK
ncbi:MAG: hypothetical protein G01um101418_72 [Parcubacteria group bacterium Gr01-1014_18]|nr:MAG: hypothetical protein Greene041636_72 [Parcubacteria group bacterium Greene0416_36]TSC81578.1 MAG: hypothetical protein G01um101418_72 [Parcubacteria group bacterium Gr01-1014_18]TSC99611.1 MAG: hypothetical protein Greene101420_15 [Parcubacteria group bacterium Greene1014_20]TSD07062.1 MAG: hypothetical protein Greene07142_374 [Parcubacteria group bacterium Greene0714_2]